MFLQGFENKCLKKIVSENNVVAGCFHLNSKFISKTKSSSPLLRSKSRYNIEVIFFSLSTPALQNHVIEGLCNFMSGNSSLYVTTLPTLVAMVLWLCIYYYILYIYIFSLPRDLAKPCD